MQTIRGDPRSRVRVRMNSRDIIHAHEHALALSLILTQFCTEQAKDFYIVTIQINGLYSSFYCQVKYKVGFTLGLDCRKSN
jgi:hypothetical protein